MLKKIIIPAAILLFLIIANILRFDTEATKAVNNATYFKWVRDRWTGELWTLRYNPSGLTEQVSSDYVVNNAAIERKKSYTYIWYMLVLGSSLWTVKGIEDYLKERKQRED